MEKYLEEIYAILNKLDNELTTEQFVAIHELIDDYPHSPDLFVFMQNFYSECSDLEATYEEKLEKITNKFLNTCRYLRNSLIHFEDTANYIETVISNKETGTSKIYGEYLTPNFKPAQRLKSTNSKDDWIILFDESKKFHTIVFELPRSVRIEPIESCNYSSIEVKQPSRKRHSERGSIFSKTVPPKRDQWFNAENNKALSQVAIAI